MTWDEIGELMETGWLIGAHTVSHPNLSDLSVKDPSGQRVREELEQCDETLEKRLGVRPRDFAYTATTWSSAAEREVMARYRFGRLWIIGAQYEADGKPIRFAELAGVPGPDQADGGPPHAARYITKETHPYRLPSMELTALIHDPDVFLIDEPFVGLDPRSSRTLKDTFRDLVGRGACIFLSTHTLTVAEEMADRIGIIRKGELIALGTTSEIRGTSGDGRDRRLEEVFLELTEGGDTSGRGADS